MDIASLSDDWRIPLKTLQAKITYIFSTALLTDLTIRVTDGECVEEFKVHSLILCIASSVFEAMMSLDFKEQTEQLIKISDVAPDIFKLLLSFIYGQRIKFSDAIQARDLYVVADKYLIYDLKNICRNYIQNNINVANACMCYEFAYLYNMPDLKESALELMRENTKDVVTSSTFSYADPKSVLAILEEKILKITEIELFHGVELWALSKDKSESFVKLVCESIIPKFHFQDMSVEEFSLGPARSELLTKDQIIAVLTNLSCSAHTFPMPEGFMIGPRNPIPNFLQSFQPSLLDSDEYTDDDESDEDFNAGDVKEVSFLNISDALYKDFSSGLSRTVTFQTNRRILITAVEVFNARATDPNYSFIEGASVSITCVENRRTSGAFVERTYTNAETSIIPLPDPMVISQSERYEIRIKMRACRVKTLDFDNIILETLSPNSVSIKFLDNICYNDIFRSSVSPLVGFYYMLL